MYQRGMKWGHVLAMAAIALLLGGTAVFAGQQLVDTLVSQSGPITLKSGAPDSSSAVAHIIDTTHAYSTPGDELVSWRNNGGEVLALQPGNTGNSAALGGGTSAATYSLPLLQFESGVLYFWYRSYDYTHSGSPSWYFTSANINPYTDNTISLGSTSSRRFAQFDAYAYDTALGSQITAAASITPTSGLQHWTGATTVTTIVATNFSGNWVFKAICDSTSCNYSTGGNISVAGSFSQGNTEIFQYDATATKWYPQ